MPRGSRSTPSAPTTIASAPTAGLVDARRPQTHRVAGLFAGIGGIEAGLHRHGHETVLLCEKEPAALCVLRTHFPAVEIAEDVTTLAALPPETTLAAAGFPCQDLSQAGRTAGIHGQNSGLVNHVFRLLEVSRDQGRPVPWVLLENVSFMLRLARGNAFRHVVDALEELGYRWAYRVVDSRAFGVPQRRERVYLVACLAEAGDPRGVLFADDAGEPSPTPQAARAFGFYWTEGIRGLGWAVDAVPTLKGGSTIGIASPPAVWLPCAPLGRRIVTPDLRDAERLQGFPENWTEPASGRLGVRWKLVGNAVTVDAAAWVGGRLKNPGTYAPTNDRELGEGDRWPDAAWCLEHGHRFAAEVSRWPVSAAPRPLATFLTHPGKPLSARATAGFLGRTKRSSLRFPDGFLDAVAEHLDAVSHEHVPG